MSDYYDDLETRDAAAREAAQFADLRSQIVNARENVPYFAETLASVDVEAITDRAALAALPLVRKSDLLDLQAGDPPFGGLTTEAPGNLARIFQSPGPIYDAEGHGRDPWRTARAFYAAGFRASEVVHNTFAYHLTPAGVMVETGAHAIGCAVVPAGTGNTELQVRAIADIRPAGYAGTPSFLKALLEKGAELGADLSSLSKAAVAGEALLPSLRAEIAGLGITVVQWYGTADLGLIAYESTGGEGLIVDEGVIVEIVRPGTGDPVAEGEVGEVVVTTSNRTYPLIRFGTGDLSAAMAGTSPCGRTNLRLKGWMGRADQTTKVKGMFVHPSQVADVVKRHPEVARARLVVDQEDGKDIMTLMCETAGTDTQAIADTLQAVTKMRGRVEVTTPGSLPNDGKVIDDVRSLT